MAFTRICSESELAEGQMTAEFIDGWEVLVVRDRDGVLHALDGICPHEDTPLIHGDFDGTVLTCLSHLWSFDATTGAGINPPGCKLAKYAIKLDGGDIYVDPDAEAVAEPGG